MCRFASESDWSRQKRGEVVEDLLGLVEVGKRLGCELGDLRMDFGTTGEEVAAAEVADFVQAVVGFEFDSRAAEEYAKG
jgi:hypothetical protein